VVDLLVSLHAREEFRLDVVVGPAEVEVEALDGVRLHVPLVLLGHMLHHCVLGL